MGVIRSADHRKNLWKNKNSPGRVGFKVMCVKFKSNKSPLDSVTREVWWLFSQLCSAALLWHRSQRRQSAKLFLQSSELGLPHSLTRRRLCPPPLWFGGGAGTHSLAGNEGGRSNSNEGGDRYCDTPGIYVLVALIFKLLHANAAWRVY